MTRSNRYGSWEQVIEGFLAAHAAGDPETVRDLMNKHSLVLWFHLEPNLLWEVLDTAIATDASRRDPAHVLQVFLSCHHEQRFFDATGADPGTRRPDAARAFQASYMLDLRFRGRTREAYEYANHVAATQPIIQPFRDSRDGWPQFLAVQRGITAMLAGEFAAALRFFEEAGARSVTPGLEFLLRDALVKAALIHATFGDPVVAEALLARAAAVRRTESWAELSLDVAVDLTRVLLESSPAVAADKLARIDLSQVGEMWPFYVHAEYRLLENASSHSQAARRIEQLKALPFARVDGQGYTGSVFALAEASNRIASGAPRHAKQFLDQADPHLSLTQVLYALLEAQVGTLPKAIALAIEARESSVWLRRMEIWRISILANAYWLQGDQADAIASMGELTQLVRPIDAFEMTFFSTEMRAIGAEHVPAWPDSDGCPETYMDQLPTQGELLTPREYEVLQALAKGLTRAEMSESLYVSVNTLKSQLRSLYRKLDASSKEEALRNAGARGLV